MLEPVRRVVRWRPRPPTGALRERVDGGLPELIAAAAAAAQQPDLTVRQLGRRGRCLNSSNCSTGSIATTATTAATAIAPSARRPLRREIANRWTRRVERVAAPPSSTAKTSDRDRQHLVALAAASAATGSLSSSSWALGDDDQDRTGEQRRGRGWRPGAPRSGPVATSTAKASSAAISPPRESVIHSARITGGSAATDAERRDPRAPRWRRTSSSSTIAAAIAAASPFQ